MYQKSWNQFLIEQEGLVGTTVDFPPANSKRIGRKWGASDKPLRAPPQARSHPSPFTTGIGAYLISKGYDLDTKLGGGVDGIVYRAIDKKTGKNVAVKVVLSTTQGDMKREAANYKFILDNRESLGQYAKYFPVVYSSEIDQIPAHKETMEGRKIEAAIIIMEQLELLPDDIARSLFTTNTHYRKDKKARTQRDKRLFKSYKLVGNLINMAISLTDPASTSPFISFEAQEKIEKSIITRMFGKTRYAPGRPAGVSPLGVQGLTDEAKELMNLFVNVTYTSILRDPTSEADMDLVMDYKDTIRRDLANAFVKAYSRPIVSGGVSDTLAVGSKLKGFDQYYSSEDEVGDHFPESVGIRKAMQALSGEGLKPFDVHNGNVMMRPKTNEIVIVDLGRFKGLETNESLRNV